MTIQDIKRISIREYLGQIGINPTRENSRYGMYHSPFREDHDASMKVDYNQNLWIDYGTGEGGSIIDLVSHIEKCSIGEAIKKLDNKSFYFHRNTVQIKQEPAIKIEKVLPIVTPALIVYLKERSINIDIANTIVRKFITPLVINLILLSVLEMMPEVSSFVINISKEVALRRISLQ